jgi:hypothetical protein
MTEPIAGEWYQVTSIRNQPVVYWEIDMRNQIKERERTMAEQLLWTDERYAAYELGMQTEREHQNALSRLVMEKHREELAAQAAAHAKALARINELERRECIAALNRIAELEAAEKNWEKAVADLTQTSLDLIDDNDELQAQLAAQAAEHAAALYELDTYRKSLDIMSGRIVQLEELQAQHAAPRWEPVSDGRYEAQHIGDFFSIDRDYLTVRDGHDNQIEIGLPEGWHICRLVQPTQAQDE